MTHPQPIRVALELLPVQADLPKVAEWLLLQEGASRCPWTMIEPRPEDGTPYVRTLDQLCAVIGQNGAAKRLLAKLEDQLFDRLSECAHRAVAVGYNFAAVSHALLAVGMPSLLDLVGAITDEMEEQSPEAIVRVLVAERRRNGEAAPAATEAAGGGTA